jgi:hypothetical protein
MALFRVLIGRADLDLTLRSDSTVKSVRVHPPTSPLFSATENEFDKTGPYEVVSLVFGDQCAEFSRIEIYRYFRNSVQPKVKYGKAHMTLR